MSDDKRPIYQSVVDATKQALREVGVKDKRPSVEAIAAAEALMSGTLVFVAGQKSSRVTLLASRIDRHFAPLREENERLKAVCAGRERRLEGRYEGDFDELCNRVVTREWMATDPELLVGYAQASFDVEAQLRERVAEQEAELERRLAKVMRLDAENARLREALEWLEGKCIRHSNGFVEMGTFSYRGSLSLLEAIDAARESDQ